MTKPTWSATTTGTSGQAMTLTSSGMAKQRRVVTWYNVVVKGASPTSDIDVTVKFGSTTKITDAIGSGASRGSNCGIANASGLTHASDVAQDIELAATAGGTGVVIIGSMGGYLL